MGSRFLGLENKMSPLRGFGSSLIRLAIRFKTGAKVTDPTCGLRMYNRRMLRLFAQRTDLAPEPDTIARLIRSGAKVAEVPVRVADRELGESYLNPKSAVRYMRRMLKAILLGR